MEPAKAIFPLSDDLGARNALAPEDEDDTSGTEANIGYDPLWVPNGLLGSPMFASRQNSHIILDLSNIFPKTITAFSILMWVRPKKSDYGTVLAARSGSMAFTLYVGSEAKVNVSHDESTIEEYTSMCKFLHKIS